MIKCSIPRPEFCLVGTVRKLTSKKNGKVKGFELETPQGRIYFKIPHKLHQKINCRLYPNANLEARGKVKISSKTAKVKLKLKFIRALSEASDPSPVDLKILISHEGRSAKN
jgi:hypothetical protein